MRKTFFILDKEEVERRAHSDCIEFVSSLLIHGGHPFLLHIIYHSGSFPINPLILYKSDDEDFPLRVNVCIVACRLRFFHSFSVPTKKTPNQTQNHTQLFYFEGFVGVITGRVCSRRITGKISGLFGYC